MALKFRRGAAAQQSGSLVFGEPYINTDLNTLLIGGNGTQIQLLNISGGISSSLVPQTGSTFDLGTATIPWRHLYIASASIKFVDGAGNVVSNVNAANIVTTDRIASGSISLQGYATTGSNSFNGNQTITGSLNISGQIVANSVYTTVETSSVIYSSGSNIFGNTNSNTHQFTGSIYASGSIIINSPNVTTGQFVGNQNGYTEFSVRNVSNGISASGDIAVYADTGNPTVNYIDMGINNSGVISSFSYAGAYIGKALDGYMYNVGGDSWWGNASTSSQTIYIFNTGSAKPMIAIGPSSFELTGSLKATNGITGQINATNGVVSGSSQILGGSGIVSGAAQITSLLPTGVVSGSSQVNFTQLSGISSGIVSSSTQIIPLLPTGTISGSSQVVGSSITTNTITLNGTSVALGSSATIPNLVSGSSQITYASISSIPSGIVSGAAQITPLLPTGVVSGSSQVVGSSITTNTITIGSTSTALGGTSTSLSGLTSVSSTGFTGALTGNASTATTLQTARNINGTSFNGSADITIANLVSGSSQITLSSTTGYSTTINQNLLTTSNVQFGSLGIGMAASGTSGRIDASGDIVAYSTSDRNFKENITPIPNALEKISKISGNTYDWKADMKDIHGFEGNDVGVIAQEIEEVLPQLVTTRETGYKAVKYDKLVALLIEGIKEQQTQIHSLTLEVENLKKIKGYN
jgi:Chaperone of endosialidase